MGQRDIATIGYHAPIEHGDTVILQGVAWRADNTMSGWRLSIDGTWRTEHGTIKNIPGMIDFIAAIVRAE